MKIFFKIHTINTYDKIRYLKITIVLKQNVIKLYIGRPLFNFTVLKAILYLNSFSFYLKEKILLRSKIFILTKQNIVNDNILIGRKLTLKLFFKICSIIKSYGFEYIKPEVVHIYIYKKINLLLKEKYLQLTFLNIKRHLVLQDLNSSNLVIYNKENKLTVFDAEIFLVNLNTINLLLKLNELVKNQYKLL